MIGSALNSFAASLVHDRQADGAATLRIVESFADYCAHNNLAAELSA